MKTASFFTFTGEGRVSIARYAPRATPAGFRVFASLAPGPWFNKVGGDEYKRRFATEIIGRLDPAETWDRLHQLVAPGVEPVLLCWEKPPWTEENFCHRRIVAEWFGEKLGFTIDEMPLPAPPPKRAQAAAPLFRR